MFKAEMYTRIKWLQKLVKDRYPNDIQMNHIITCAQLFGEVKEIMDCMPWKYERGMEKESRERLLEETIDLFRYFGKLLDIHKITEEEFKKAFEKKSNIFERLLLNGKSYNASMEK